MVVLCGSNVLALCMLCLSISMSVSVSVVCVYVYLFLCLFIYNVQNVCQIIHIKTSFASRVTQNIQTYLNIQHS